MAMVIVRWYNIIPRKIDSVRTRDFKIRILAFWDGNVERLLVMLDLNC